MNIIYEGGNGDKCEYSMRGIDKTYKIEKYSPFVIRQI